MKRESNDIPGSQGGTLPPPHASSSHHQQHVYDVALVLNDPNQPENIKNFAAKFKQLR